MSGLLLVLLGALGTGLPTHGHGIDDGDVAELVAPDHHGHSVILTEQSDRLPTMPGTFAVATTTTTLGTVPVLTAAQAPPLRREAPHERAPPSASPRAPPVPT